MLYLSFSKSTSKDDIILHKVLGVSDSFLHELVCLRLAPLPAHASAHAWYVMVCVESVFSRQLRRKFLIIPGPWQHSVNKLNCFRSGNPHHFFLSGDAYHAHRSTTVFIEHFFERFCRRRNQPGIMIICPTQSIIYVFWQVIRFLKRILLIVQKKTAAERPDVKFGEKKICPDVKGTHEIPYGLWLTASGARRLRR